MSCHFYKAAIAHEANRHEENSAVFFNLTLWVEQLKISIQPAIY